MDTVDFLCYDQGGVGNKVVVIKLPASCCGIPTIVTPPLNKNKASHFGSMSCKKHIFSIVTYKQVWDMRIIDDVEQLSNESYGATCACGNYNEYVIKTDKYICYNCR